MTVIDRKYKRCYSVGRQVTVDDLRNDIEQCMKPADSPQRRQ